MHVPKTAGTSLRAFFQHNGFREELFDGGGPQSLNHLRRCAPQHMHAAQVMALFRPARFNLVFMTVREPMSRVLSEYCMHIREAKNVPPLGSWFEQMSANFIEDNWVAENHIRPQSEFWLPNCHIFRIEDGLGENLVSLMESKLGMPLTHREIGSHNASNSTPIDPAEIERVRPLVLDFYWQDYLRFGYPLALRE